jgi:excisionase family DNA binding protein
VDFFMRDVGVCDQEQNSDAVSSSSEILPGYRTYLDVDEAADYLRLSTSKLYKLTRAKELAHRKHGGRVVFHRRDLDEYSDRCLVPAIAEARSIDFSNAGDDDIARSLKSENSRRRGTKPRKSVED